MGAMQLPCCPSLDATDPSRKLDGSTYFTVQVHLEWCIMHMRICMLVIYIYSSHAADRVDHACGFANLCHYLLPAGWMWTIMLPRSAVPSRCHHTGNGFCNMMLHCVGWLVSPDSRGPWSFGWSVTRPAGRAAMCMGTVLHTCRYCVCGCVGCGATDEAGTSRGSSRPFGTIRRAGG